MKLSGLISRAQAFLERHGDVDVIAVGEAVKNEPLLYRDREGRFTIDADQGAFRYEDEHPDDVAERLGAVGAIDARVVVTECPGGHFWHAEIDGRPDVDVYGNDPVEVERRARSLASLPPAKDVNR